MNYSELEPKYKTSFTKSLTKVLTNSINTFSYEQILTGDLDFIKTIATEMTLVEDVLWREAGEFDLSEQEMRDLIEKCILKIQQKEHTTER